MKKVIELTLTVFLLISILTGCATYHQQQAKFQQYYGNEDFSRADVWLDNHAKEAQGRNRLLHYFNRGTVAFQLQNRDKSIQYFQKADHYIEDYIKKTSTSALALISNPAVKPYQPENFEAVLLHFYQSLNYVGIKDYEGALVESRRVNLTLNKLDDKYKSKKNRYKRDAFANYLQGIIYEADNNQNDAFIAYRNAYNVYKTDYKKHYDMVVPNQLKSDLLASAANNGFSDEVEYYEKQFDLKHEKAEPKPELIVFWLNGLAPFKDETSLNFVKTRSGGGLVLKDDKNDLAFTFPTTGLSSKEKSALGSANIIRVAFPKYIERRPIYKNATIVVDGVEQEAQLVEDVNAIAFKCLKDRMNRELGTALLRLAIKQSLKFAVQESTKAIGKGTKNEASMNVLGDVLGLAVSVVNAATEKADTRNWQTLPHSISVMRIPLKEGENNVQFKYENDYNSMTDDFIINAEGKKKYFRVFHTIK